MLGDIKTLGISIDTQGPFAQLGCLVSCFISFSIHIPQNVKEFDFVKGRE
jgi:hypothetical protein